MISNQILQTTLDGLKGITRIDLGICDTEGKYLLLHLQMQKSLKALFWHFVDSPADSQVIQGYQFLRCLMSTS